MSQPITTAPAAESVHYNYPVYLWNYAITDLEGRLLTLVESLGLPQKQEDAVKSHARQIAWRVWDEGYVIPRPIVEEMFKRNDIVQVREYNPYGTAAGKSSNKPRKRSK